MTSPGLDRKAIGGLLEELNEELGRRGAKADLFLVGGAALALVYDQTRSTRDLDAVFLPTEVVRSAAGSLAERHGLPADWLNDAVKGFLPGPVRPRADISRPTISPSMSRRLSTCWP
ncbi:MAG: DUF6036 family nucleotidyltransferase [Frankia sp.]